MATLERKTAIIEKVLSEVNLDINDGNVHKYADYTGFVKPRLNAIYDIISKIAPTPFVVNNNYVGKSIANLRRYNLIASVDIDNNTYVINHNAMFFGNFNQFIETYNKLYDGKYAPVNKYNKINLRNTTLDDFVDNIDEYFRNNIYDNILTKEEINSAVAINQNELR